MTKLSRLAGKLFRLNREWDEQLLDHDAHEISDLIEKHFSARVVALFDRFNTTPRDFYQWVKDQTTVKYAFATFGWVLDYDGKVLTQR